MTVEPSRIPGILICGQEAPEFAAGLDAVLNRAPLSVLKPALPFSVILTNASSRAVAFIGIRFDMMPARGQLCSVVHYADTLRNPSKADFLPGASRFFCAEPSYTALVLRSGSAADRRGRMNVDNLRRMTSVRASLDCIAFADGNFAGPDSQRAFERLADEHRAEKEFLAEVLTATSAGLDTLTALLVHTAEASDRAVLRAAARKLISGLDADGIDGVRAAALAFRHRIGLSR